MTTLAVMKPCSILVIGNGDGDGDGAAAEGLEARRCLDT